VGRRGSVAVIAFLIFNSIFATNAPSPLYVIYQAKFHFSSLTLTGVYAIYAVGIVIALLGVGQASDQIGRRPVLLLAMVLTAAGAALFIGAVDPVMLFVARAVQGLATGTMASTASAAMADLSTPETRHRASLITTLSFTAGAGLGSLSSGLLAQYVPDPLVVVFVVVLVITGITIAGLIAMPEPAHARVAQEWHFQRPGVPRSIVAPFVTATLALVIAWAIGGVFGSLAPSMTRQLLHIQSHAFAGVMLFSFNVLGGTAQLVLRGRTPRRLMVVGAVIIIFGVGLIDLAVTEHVAAVFLVATAFAGAGSSLGFVGSLSLMNDLAPPTQRAEVLAAFNLIGYLGLSLPVLGMGLLTSSLGLGGATGVFAAVIAGLALTVLGLISSRRFGPPARAVLPTTLELAERV
jgi:MFS family permease